MGVLHSQDPRSFGVKGPREGKQYFFPSEAVTANGKFIPAETLMMDDYCLKCHKDAYEGWFHSSHHFSSFNNKAYLSSVRETRKVSLERDGNTQAARWCAGCHDPVPFFSGEFDDPNYDDVNNPTEPGRDHLHGLPRDHQRQQHPRQRRLHDRGAPALPVRLQRQPGPPVGQQHAGQGQARDAQEDVPEAGHQGRRSSARPATRSACPYALNHYKDFLRGQNHYDTFLLSGVSGHGARSFYYPPVAKAQVRRLPHEPQRLERLRRQGLRRQGRPRDPRPPLPRRQHRPGRHPRATPRPPKRTQSSSKDKKVRVDLFALREGGAIDGALLGPLRPEVPDAQAGQAVPGRGRRPDARPRPSVQPGDGRLQRDLGRADRQGRATGSSAGRAGIGPDGTVDPYSHFINVYMLDRDGNRIDRRNPQDIFVPLYNKQIPPGAGQVVHFGLEVPDGLDGADHAGGEGQLPQVRPQVHGLRLRQGARGPSCRSS